jgi:hypothetical protein
VLPKLQGAQTRFEETVPRTAMKEPGKQAGTETQAGWLVAKPKFSSAMHGLQSRSELMVGGVLTNVPIEQFFRFWHSIWLIDEEY